MINQQLCYENEDMSHVSSRKSLCNSDEWRSGNHGGRVIIRGYGSGGDMVEDAFKHFQDSFVVLPKALEVDNSFQSIDLLEASVELCQVIVAGVVDILFYSIKICRFLESDQNITLVEENSFHTVTLCPSRLLHTSLSISGSNITFRSPHNTLSYASSGLIFPCLALTNF
ncbi:hypothetical protein Tco_0580285 [Tanacetum coccineum]